MTPRQLKALRSRLGLTQEALAAHLGVSRRTVAYWESDRSAAFRHPSGMALKLLRLLQNKGVADISENS